MPLGAHTISSISKENVVNTLTLHYIKAHLVYHWNKNQKKNDGIGK